MADVWGGDGGGVIDDGGYDASTNTADSGWGSDCSTAADPLPSDYGEVGGRWDGGDDGTAADPLPSDYGEVGGRWDGGDDGTAADALPSDYGEAGGRWD